MKRRPAPTPAAPEAPVLHGGPQIGHNRLPGQNAGGWKPRPCPECMKLFERRVANQLFCTPQHKADWNNRATARGRVLTPLSMVARITRNGTRGTDEEKKAGREASNLHNALIQKYRDEDRAADPPRMSWPQYMIRRFRLGFDPL